MDVSLRSDDGFLSVAELLFPPAGTQKQKLVSIFFRKQRLIATPVQTIESLRIQNLQDLPA